MELKEIEILLVEDNADDLELAMKALRNQNVANRIEVARDGAEALEVLMKPNGHVPRLILLDLKLPKVDGLEVLRQIKATERTRNVPVVVMTSSREERDLVESYRLGVNSYIQKPVDFVQFSEVIRNIGMYWLVFNQMPVLAPEKASE